MYKTKSFREKLGCVIVSTFLIFSVVDQLYTRGRVFSTVLYNLYQKTTLADFRCKSLKSWKIDNTDLTQQFSFSIFTAPISVING